MGSRHGYPKSETNCDMSQKAKNPVNRVFCFLDEIASFLRTDSQNTNVAIHSCKMILQALSFKP